ncbi:MAG: replicative DNA helicase [Chlamydiales bacterium]
MNIVEHDLKNAGGRVPPHDDGAEKSVIGAILADPARVPDVAESLRAEDFYNKRHQIVYETIMELTERNVLVDLLSISGALKAAGTLGDVGGNAYLAQLSAVVSSAAHMTHHVNLVVQTSILRRLIHESVETIDEAYATPPDTESVGELLDNSEFRVFKISENRDRGGAVSISSIVDETFKRFDARGDKAQISGIPSGFYELDDMLGGFNEGELIVIAARPSMGKTAFVLNLMDHAATHRPEGAETEPSVLFFSLEMGRMAIVQRMLCARARVDAHKLRTGRIPNEDYSELVRAAGELQSARLFIDDSPGLSVMALRSRARRVKAQYGLDMIVIDYLQLMTAPRAESRQQEISTISRSLKELGRELEVPVVALSQLSRAVENREQKRPQLSDLRESGAIEQDADVVLMLFREEYYEQTPENQNKAEIICAKQRNGPTGAVTLRFFGNHLRFENPEPSLAEPILP